MSSIPALKILKKVSLEDEVSDIKNEEQIIQISVGNGSVEAFTSDAVAVVGLGDVDTIDQAKIHINDDPSSSQENLGKHLPLPVIHFELSNSDIIPDNADSKPSSSVSQSYLECRPKVECHEDNVFMIPPLLRVRQFPYQERLPISINEIRRRINPPESLSQAVILSLLRLNRERAKHLRKALTQFGITELPIRSTVVSSFSRLCEAESKGLAEDYYYLASRFMKVREMNESLALLNGGRISFSAKAQRTKKVLEQILSEIEKRDSNLTLLTHGFSPFILHAVFNIITEILNYKEEDQASYAASNISL